MASLQEMAINLISNTPRFKNNPTALNYLAIIKDGRSEEGARIAENLCKTYGVSKEDAVSQAKAFFNFK